MARFERVLLYTVTFVVVGILFLDERVPRDEFLEPANAKAESDRGPTPTFLDGRPSSAVDGTVPRRAAEKGNVSPKVESDVARTSDSRAATSLTLVDREGRPRIVLDADAEGGPRVVVRDADGAEAIVLSVQSSDEAQIRLTRGDRKAGIVADAEGNLAVELLGAGGSQTRMHVAADGQSEVVCGSGAKDVQALLRADRDGGGEVVVRNPVSNRGPALSMRADGDAAIGFR